MCIINIECCTYRSVTMEIDSVSPVTISKFGTAAKEIFSLIIWQEDSFHMTLFDGGTSWTGLFLPESVSEFAKLLNLSVEEYFKHVKIAMLNHSSGYLYDFNISGNSSSFMWILKEGQIKIQHGSVELVKDEPAKSKDALIEALLFKNINLEREVDNLKSINLKMTSELMKSENELKKIENCQSDLEKTLYGKFVQLLNTKKERIKILEEHLNKFES